MDLLEGMQQQGSQVSVQASPAYHSAAVESFGAPEWDSGTETDTSSDDQQGIDNSDLAGMSDEQAAELLFLSTAKE